VRSGDKGGPYRQWRCSCGTESGALQNAAGAWLLHPLEGLDDSDLIERLIPRQSRAEHAAAVEWWNRNAAQVERFRRGEPVNRSRHRAGESARHTKRPPPRPRPRQSSQNTTGEAPRRPRPQTPTPPVADEFELRSPHDLLGVEEGAPADDIARAYRKALKLCHPDRVANLDPDLQELAHRKSKALRRAYEMLMDSAG